MHVYFGDEKKLVEIDQGSQVIKISDKLTKAIYITSFENILGARYTVPTNLLPGILQIAIKYSGGVHTETLCFEEKSVKKLKFFFSDLKMCTQEYIDKVA